MQDLNGNAIGRRFALPHLYWARRKLDVSEASFEKGKLSSSNRFFFLTSHSIHC